jgi:hypothetical protein
MRREPDAIGILYRRAQLAEGNFSDVQVELSSWLDAGISNVTLFAERFPPGISFEGVDKLILAGYDLVAAFKRAEVSNILIERLLEDCPGLGIMSTEAPAATTLSVVDEVDLDDPVTYENLSSYTAWKFPEKPVSDKLQKVLLRDLDLDRFPNLQMIEDAVERAKPAVEAYEKEQPQWFRFGTDYITKSLGFIDEKFRKKHAFAQKTRFAFIKYKDLIAKRS